jgi:hypothetical protein
VLFRPVGVFFTLRPRTKRDDAQNQRREDSDIQHYINHASIHRKHIAVRGIDLSWAKNIPGPLLSARESKKDAGAVECYARATPILVDSVITNSTVQSIRWHKSRQLRKSGAPEKYCVGTSLRRGQSHRAEPSEVNALTSSYSSIIVIVTSAAHEPSASGRHIRPQRRVRTQRYQRAVPSKTTHR